MLYPTCCQLTLNIGIPISNYNSNPKYQYYMFKNQNDLNATKNYLKFSGIKKLACEIIV